MALYRSLWSKQGPGTPLFLVTQTRELTTSVGLVAYPSILRATSESSSFLDTSLRVSRTQHEGCTTEETEGSNVTGNSP